MSKYPLGSPVIAVTRSGQISAAATIAAIATMPVIHSRCGIGCRRHSRCSPWNPIAAANASAPGCVNEATSANGIIAR